MEITVDTSNKEDVKKAIEILRGFLDENTSNYQEDYSMPSMDFMNNSENQIQPETMNIEPPKETPSLNSMIENSDEVKEEEDGDHFSNGVMTY